MSNGARPLQVEHMRWVRHGRTKVPKYETISVSDFFARARERPGWRHGARIRSYNPKLK